MSNSPTVQVRPARGRIGVVLVVLVLGAAAWLAVSRAAEETASNASASGDSVIEQFDVGDRVSVDRFTARLLDGAAFDSASVGTRASVYNVWGSWCGPCRLEAPDLRQVALETAGEVAFVGINVRDGSDAAVAFERANEVPYPSIRAADSAEALLSFGTSLGVTAVPTTLVLDQQGRIAARVVGATTYATLVALVEDVLAESAPDDPAS